MASAPESLLGTCKAVFLLLVLLLSPAAPTATAAVLSARGKFFWAPRDAPDVYPSEISRAHANSAAPTPIVVWHGLGDSCCNPDSIGGVVDAIKQHLPGEPPLARHPELRWLGKRSHWYCTYFFPSLLSTWGPPVPAFPPASASDAHGTRTRISRPALFARGTDHRTRRLSALLADTVQAYLCTA
jgi:hypothetical protein